MMLIAKLNRTGNFILSNVGGIIVCVFMELTDILDILEEKCCKEWSTKYLFCFASRNFVYCRNKRKVIDFLL